MSCFTSENGLTPEKPLCLPYDILNDGFLYYILCQIKAHAAERRRTQLRAFGMGLSVPAEQRDAGVKRGDIRTRMARALSACCPAAQKPCSPRAYIANHSRKHRAFDALCRI